MLISGKKRMIIIDFRRFNWDVFLVDRLGPIGSGPGSESENFVFIGSGSRFGDFY